LLAAVGASAETTEKVFASFVLAGLYGLCYIAAIGLLRLLKYDPNGWKKHAIIGSYILFSVGNVFALYSLSQLGFAFAWGSPVLSLVAILCLASLKERRLKWGALAGALLGSSSWLDPRLYVWGSLILMTLALSQLFLTKRRNLALKTVGLAFLVSVPGALLTAFAYQLAGQGALGPPLRETTTSSFEFLSGNAQPLWVFVLMGHVWSYVTYAPPTVLMSPGGIQNMPTLGNAPFIVLPPGPLSSLWMLSLFATPIYCLCALFAHRFRPASLFFAAVALLGLSLSMGSRLPIPPAVSAQVALGSVPVIGSVWQTTIGVPDNAQVLTTSGLAPLFMVATIRVIEWRTSVWKTGLMRRALRKVGIDLRYSIPPSGQRRLKSLLIIATVSLLSLGSWQFFTGSFYPAAFSPGLPGNAIPNHGTMQPIPVPGSVATVAHSLQSLDPASSVFWPVGTPGSGGISPPLPISTLVNLMKSNLSTQVAPLLRAYGIRYFVLQNVSHDFALYLFGSTDVVRSLAEFLARSPGLSVIQAAPPDIWIFEIQKAGPVIQAFDLPLASSGPANSYTLAIAAASMNDFRPMLIPEQRRPPGLNLIQTTVDDNLSAIIGASQLAIFTPGFFGLASPSGVATGFNGAQNVSVSLAAAQSQTTTLPVPYEHWSVSTWSSQTANISVQGGRKIAISQGPSSLTSNPVITLNYLTPLTAGTRAGIEVPGSNSTSVTVSGHLEFTTSADFQGTIQAYFVSNDASLRPLPISVSSPAYAPSSIWSTIDLSGTLPRGTNYFAFRLTMTGTGELSARNIKLIWSFADIGTGGLTNSGLVRANSNTSLPISSGAHVMAVEAKGRGNLSQSCPGFDLPRTVDSSTFDFFRFPYGAPGGGCSLRVSGNITLGVIAIFPNLLSSPLGAVVDRVTGTHAAFSFSVIAGGPALIQFSAPFNPNWILEGPRGALNRPFLSGFGTNLYIVPAQGSYTVKLENFSLLQVGLLVVPSGYVAAGVVAHFWGSRGSRREDAAGWKGMPEAHSKQRNYLHRESQTGDSRPARRARRALSWSTTVVSKAGRIGKQVRLIRVLTLSIGLLAIAASLAAGGSYELANLAAVGAYFTLLLALAISYCDYLYDKIYPRVQGSPGSPKP